MPAPSDVLAEPGNAAAGISAAVWSGSLGLFGARAAAAGASFVANIYLAKTLGASEFGTYSFTLAVLAFCALFFDFGYFSSAARLLAGVGPDEDRRAYAGAMVIIAGAVSALFVAFILILSLAIDYVFAEGIGRILALTAAATPAMIAPFFLEQALKGSRQVLLLTGWTAATRGLFLVAVITLGVLQRLTAAGAVLASLLSGLVGLGIVLVWMRPRLRGLAPYLSDIAAEHRRFGRALYAGRTANLATYNVDRLLIAYFRDATAVGYYGLAMAFSSFVAMFSSSIEVAAFRDFSDRRPISPSLQRWNLTGILVTSAAVLAGGYLVVRWYLGSGYSSVGVILVPAVAAVALQGAYQPYKGWLLANGLGVELRRLLFIVAAVNLLGNAVLIPVAGAIGAALASAAGTGTFLLLAARTYRSRHA